jgi:hypothetical protein
MSAEQQQELLDEAERRAEELKALQDRAVAIVATILGASLLAAMPRIRKAYRRYMEALRPAEKDPAGNTYRPVAGTGAQAAKRLAEIQAAAAAFAGDRDMQRLEREIASVLRAAALYGAENASVFGSIQGLAIGERLAINDELMQAKLAAVTSSIKAKATGFRQTMTEIVADGAARDISGKRVEKLIIQAYAGVSQPDGTTVKGGLLQSIGLDVATEVSVTSGGTAIAAARAAGAEYVRFVTATDELVCSYCSSRHGKIYLADRIVIPVHPRCRCQAVIVDAEQVNIDDPERRHDTLDAPFWISESDRAIRTYANAHNLTPEQAQRRLDEYLNRPTAAEKLRYPGATTSVPPSYSPPPPDFS